MALLIKTKLNIFIGDSIMDIREMDKKNLNVLTKDEIKDILKEEWDICLKNYELRSEFTERYSKEKDIIIRILELFFKEKGSSMEVINNNPDSIGIAKLNHFVFRHSEIKNEDDFIYYLKILYLNGYLQRMDLIDIDCLEPDQELGMCIPGTNTVKLEHNLRWIFNNYEELFDAKVLWSEGDKVCMDEGGVYFRRSDSPEEIYKKFIEMGTMTDMLCSFDSLLALSHKGMNLLNIDLYQKSSELINQQKNIIEQLENSIQEQENMKNELENTQTKLNDTYSELKASQEKLNNTYLKMEKEFTSHSEKIKQFYKDITTILSILVAAFSFIGINISAIPKIEENFTTNILLLNLSLILCISVMFYIIKRLVFNFPNEGEKDNKEWIGLFIICSLGIISILFIGDRYNDKQIIKIEQRYKSQFDLELKKRDEAIDDLKVRNSIIDEKIELLKEKIE